VHINLARGAGVVGATFALTLVFGTTTAVASNEYVGQTFNDAANAIASGGQSYQIRTRFGTFLPTGACIVSASSVSSLNGIVRLDLNCNYMFAAPGVPGNSRGSVAGRTAFGAAQAAAAEQKDLPGGG
jgi:hypothetical protein